MELTQERTLLRNHQSRERNNRSRSVAHAGRGDVERAVRAARKAYEKYWRKMEPADRAKYIFRIARAITERSRELAVLESLDGGKPIKESRDFDIPTAAAHFFYYAGWADKLEWALRAGREPHPMGVAGQIVPWNFPLLMAAWKIAPALACGNTVVLKPAETTPLTALALAQIVQEADLPPGVVNVITGDGATGAALVAERGRQDCLHRIHGRGQSDSARARRNGETADARTRRKSGAHRIRRCAHRSSDRRHRQRHLFQPGPRLLRRFAVACTGERAHEEIVVRLTERLQTLRLGDPLDKNTDIGAINSRAQLDKIQELVRSGIDQGAVLVQQSCSVPERGYYFPAHFSRMCSSHIALLAKKSSAPSFRF